MTREGHDSHLSPELMQGFLDGELSHGEADRVQEHTASCARCRSEMEAWQSLFEGLGGLTEVAPGPAFREAVLGAIPRNVPAPGVGQRVLGWLRPSRRRSAAAGVLAPLHPGAERIQDFLEGLLPRSEAVSLEAHLHGCHGCRSEVDDWRRVMASVAQLPALEPSAEFSERVMAHVRVQLALVAARPTVAERLQILAGSVTPRTRRRLAALAGAGVTPAVTIGLLAYVVFSHPLVTLGNLLSFAWLQGSARVSSFGAGIAQRTTESEILFRLYQAIEVMFGSPGTAALALTGLAGLTLTALWVVYRNVLAGPSHAR